MGHGRRRLGIGQRAAEAALRQIGALKEPDEDRPARRTREPAHAAAG